MKNVTPHMDTQIRQLFDAIVNYDCVSQEDIMNAGGFNDLTEVGQALTWSRHPDIAAHYGWTVPHVRRGRPRQGQTRRYLVVELNGSVLTQQDNRLVQEGAQSTVRVIAATTRNEANALRMSQTVAVDKQNRKVAGSLATILDGVSQTATLEAERLERLLSKTKP